MKNTRLLFVIWMLFLVLPQGYSQGKKEDSSVLGQVNGFLSKHVKLTAYGQFGYRYGQERLGCESGGQSVFWKAGDADPFGRYHG